MPVARYSAVVLGRCILLYRHYIVEGPALLLYWHDSDSRRLAKREAAAIRIGIPIKIENTLRHSIFYCFYILPAIDDRRVLGSCLPLPTWTQFFRRIVTGSKRKAGAPSSAWERGDGAMSCVLRESSVLAVDFYGIFCTGCASLYSSSGGPSNNVG